MTALLLGSLALNWVLLLLLVESRRLLADHRAKLRELRSDPREGWDVC